MKENDLLIGFHPLMEAIKSGKEIQKVFIQKGLTADRMPDLKQELNKHEIPMFIVPREKLERISRKNHQGIIAFTSPIEFQNLENLLFSLFEEGKNPSFLMLDGITDVRNFGAIVRSAECMGVHAVIIPVKGMAPINADAVKSSSGALLRVPICRSTHLDKTLSFLRNSGIKVVGCTEKSTENIDEVSLIEPLCIVMGNEETGLSEKTIQTADHLVKIPMIGDVASLNVSASCAVALYETLRQRIKAQ